MAEIMKFNTTAEFGQPGYSVLQRGWRASPYYMGRIPADYGLPIMCTSSNGFRAMLHVESEGRDYDAIAPCCPFDTVTPGGSTTVLRLEQNMGVVLCFTNDTAVATRWPRCVAEAVRAQIERVRVSADNATLVRFEKGNITVANAGGGSGCEYVDYESLKQGIVHKSGGGGMREGLGGSAVWGLTAGLMAVVAVSHGL